MRSQAGTDGFPIQVDRLGMRSHRGTDGFPMQVDEIAT